MKSFKKSIVFLMVAALVFGTVAPAFAATPSDVVATTYEDAVGKLVALGIINGYEDGTFQPEKSITRAEFAKIACYVVGQQDAANLSKGTATKFSDVSSTHWASGFVSVASNQGLLKGYPNGTFKPEANVTYAEAITILVRALGMSPVVEGKGTWPANYMAKAAEVGMFDNVTGLTGNDNAVRGNIAKLSLNTMEQEKWAASGYNDKGEINYGPKVGVTLLSDRYKKYTNSATGELDIVKDQYVIATRIVADMNDNVVALDDNAAGSSPEQVKVVDGLDMSQYIGCKIDYLRFTDSTTDKYVSYVQNKSTVVNGKITEVKTSNKVVVNGKDYEVASSLLTGNKVMVNYGKSSYEDFATLTSDVNGGTKTVMGRLVIDPDTSKVSSISVVTPETIVSNVANKTVAQFVVKEVKTNGAVTDYEAATQFDLDDVTDNDTKDKKETIFVKNGKLATKADVKVGDVVVRMNDFVFITDNKVTGKVTGITTKDEVSVNGVKYSKTSIGALMTKNGKVEDGTTLNSTVTDYLNKDVTLSLNSVGDYALLSGSVNSSAADQYGMLTQKAWRADAPDANGKRNYFVELRTMTGEKRSFQITGSDDAIAYSVLGIDNGYFLGNTVNNIDLTGATTGTLIRYIVSADGKIDAKDIEVVVNTDSTSDYNYVAIATGKVLVSDDAKSIIDNTVPASPVRYYFSDTESVILNNKAGTVEKATNWDALSMSSSVNVFTDHTADGTYNANITGVGALMVVDKDTNIVKVLAIAAPAYISSNDKVYGVVTDAPYYGLDSDNNSKTFVKIFNENSTKTYEVSSATIASFVYGDEKLEVGDFVVYTVNTDNEVSGIADETDKVLIVANDGNKFDTSYVKSFGDSIVTFDNVGGSARLDSDVKVYDASGATPAMVSTSEIKAGIMARAIDTDTVKDGLADVVVILSK